MLSNILWFLFWTLCRVIITCLLVWITYALFRLHHLKRKYSHLPQLPSNFLFGNLKLFVGNFPFRNHKSINQLATDALIHLADTFQEQKLCVVWLGPRPRIILYDPDFIGQISNNHLNRTAEYELFKHLQSVLFNGEERQWRSRRRLLSSLYSVANASAQTTIFNQESQRLIQSLRPDDHDTGERLVDDASRCALQCAVRIIFRSAFGIHLNDLDQLHTFLDNADQFIRGVMISSLFGSERVFLHTPPGQAFRRSIEQINAFARQLFEQKLNEFEVERGELELLKYLEERNSSVILEQILRIHLKQQEQLKESPGSVATDELLTLDQVIGETLVFVFGGIDTATTALCFTLYLLGLHEDVQEKVYEEVLDVTNDGDLGQPLTSDHLNRLKYLEACIKESSRIFSNPAYGRRLDRDEQLGPYFLPAGSEVIVDTLNMHRRTEFYEQPTAFRPERFLQKVLPPNTFLTFSTGPRNCAGQKFALLLLKCVLANLVRSLHIRSLVPRHRMQVHLSFVTHPDTPLRTRFKSRD